MTEGQLEGAGTPLSDSQTDQRCPFCDPAPDRLIGGNAGAVAFLDGYPIATGHALVVPRRHVTSIFDLAPPELDSVWKLVKEVRVRLRALHSPDGFTIGVNDGPAAGQTIAHAHVHVVPRLHGDVADPRGGVRWVIPAKADYWSARG